MARYTGPRARRARRLGVALSNFTLKDPDKDGSLRRPYPPGAHGQSRVVKPSDYARKLMEKQKLKLAYELLEHQLQRVVTEAKRSDHVQQRILELLESRFDVLVWRAGLATSLRQARQMVRHQVFTVDGAKANLPGERLRGGAVVQVRERFRAHALVQGILARTGHIPLPGYLQRADDRLSFTVLRTPDEVVLPFDVDLMRVIEFYAA